MKIIQQLPCLNADRICPVCGHEITQTKKCQIELHTLKRTTSKLAEYDFPFCVNCQLPFANIASVQKVYAEQRELGFYMSTYKTNKRCSFKSVQNRMFQKRKYNEAARTKFSGKSDSQTKSKHQKKVNALEYEIVGDNYTIWSKCSKLITRKSQGENCPRCHTKLSSDYTLIPSSHEKRYKVNGEYCSRCRCLYVGSGVDKLLRDNPLAKDFSLDDQKLWNATECEQRRKQQLQNEKIRREQEARLRLVPSSVVMICVEYDDNIKKEIIITERKNASNELNDIYYYASAEGIEFLSAAFAPKRNKKGKYKEKKFYVTGTILRDSSLKDLYLPFELQIKSGGGDYPPKGDNEEVIDLLLYSPYYGRYKIIHATYNKTDSSCYVDGRLFRRFCNDYGNPEINLEFDKSKDHYGHNHDFSELNSESILKEFGYSVSQTDNLSAKARQEILADVIDLKIVTIPEVISYLDFFISNHSADRYVIARSKWQQDKQFIENYKVNPSRFRIARNGRL